jgi:hypothetical protein
MGFLFAKTTISLFLQLLVLIADDATGPHFGGTSFTKSEVDFF